MATVIPYLLHRSEPDVGHYRVTCEVGEDTGITVCIRMRVVWPHDLLVTRTSTFENCLKRMHYAK